MPSTLSLRLRRLIRPGLVAPRPWPAFNLADATLLVGAGVLIVALLRSRLAAPPQE